MKEFRRVASQFIVGVKDLEFTDELLDLINNFEVSGLALFNSPHDSPSFIWNDPDAALEAYYAFIRNVPQSVQFIAADQEGGRVRRLRKPFIELPAARKIGERFEEQPRRDLIFSLYQLVARQMRLARIKLNFSPVCDLLYEQSSDVIGDRSFSDRLDTVVELAQVVCEASSSEGLDSTLKHAPGLGPTEFDPHEKVAVMFKSEAELMESDLLAFEKAAGSASAAMPPHMAFPENPERIVSLDAEFVKNLKTRLPSHLRWITDDLANMKAVSELKPWIACLEAPYDFILVCGTPEQSVGAIEDCIRHLEKKDWSFSEENQIEMKWQHCKEAFQDDWENIPDFKNWRSEILEISERANEILEEFFNG